MKGSHNGSKKIIWCISTIEEATGHKPSEEEEPDEGKNRRN